MGKIITVDGPAGSGKSTIAKKLAKQLAFTFFETGAMYRAITYGLLEAKVNIKNLGDVQSYLDNITFKIRSILNDKHYFIDGEDISSFLRDPRVTSRVSEVSAIPAVRDAMTKIQRQLAENVNAVFEGRDMGSAVFPNADLKIFLTASPEERAKRRYRQFVDNKLVDENLYDENKILAEINNRDKADMNRQTSPLLKPEGAYEVDTTNLSIDQVVQKILQYWDQTGGAEAL